MRNNYVIEGDKAIIDVKTKGKIIKVTMDLEDIHHLEGKTLGMVANGYTGYRHNKKAYYLHRVIMNTPSNKIVDHISGDRQDNRKANLRNVTHLENNRNMNNKRNSDNRLPRNICWDKKGKCYVVKLTVNNKTIYCGRSKDLEEAKELAKQSREKHWGANQ